MSPKKSSSRRRAASNSSRPASSPKRRSAPRRKTAKKSSHPPGAQRLNKVLAAAGFGSRRAVEELIVQGRVEIDREIVTDLACRVDPQTVQLKVDGVVVKKPKHVYYALNKPTGVLSTNSDPSGRMRVIDFVPDKERVFSVGRLDRSSEGLTLLTNDGELAQRLAHPRFAVPKTYFVVVAGDLTEEELNKLRKGVHLAEGFARIDGAKIRKHRRGATELEIVLSEGKNREIRRILARAGHKVVVLRRIAIGPLKLGQMPVGAARELTPQEVKALYAITDEKNRKRKPTAKKVAKSATKKAGSANSTVKPQVTAQWDDEDDDLVPLTWGADGSLSEAPGFDSLPLDTDDDFVGGFTSSTEGSVLDYDLEPASDDQGKRKKRGVGTKSGSGGNRGKKKTAARGSRKTPRKKSTSRKSAPHARSSKKTASKRRHKR